MNPLNRQDFIVTVPAGTPQALPAWAARHATSVSGRLCLSRVAACLMGADPAAVVPSWPGKPYNNLPPCEVDHG